jgi:hypothetical protein
MNVKWRDAVSDPHERRVFEALEDERWDFRTVPALAKSAELPEDHVRAVLRRYPQFIRQSFVPDSRGRALYTLASKGAGLREWYATARAFITKST